MHCHFTVIMTPCCSTGNGSASATELHQNSAGEKECTGYHQASMVRSTHQELVRVPAHGVCVLAATHVMPQPLAEQCSATPGPVHMQPDPVLPAHLLVRIL